jgi:hypothetical protein
LRRDSPNPLTWIYERWENAPISMAQYDVYVTCKECSAVHPMGIGISLDNGPIDKQNISETYQGRSLPPQVQAIKGHKTLCLKTGKQFIQEDNRQVFLVPVKWKSADLDPVFPRRSEDS